MSISTSIPVRRQSDDPQGTVGADAMLLSWAVVALLAACAVLLRWRRRRASGAAPAAGRPVNWARLWSSGHAADQRITAGASIRLTPQHSVHEVVWGERRLLICCGQQSVVLLAEAPKLDREQSTET